jgi:hypothetical protein
MAKDGLGELHGFVEAYGDDEEWKSLGKRYWIDWDRKGICQWQGKDEGEAARDESAERQPEIGTQFAEGDKEVEEGDVHEKIA